MAEANFIEEGMDRIEDAFRSIEKDFRRLQKRADKRRKQFEKQAEKRVKQLQADIRNNRVVKRADRLGLTAEASQRLAVRCELLRQKLEDGAATELGVLGQVDGALVAFAELLEDLVAGYGLADHSLPNLGGCGLDGMSSLCVSSILGGVRTFAKPDALETRHSNR